MSEASSAEPEECCEIVTPMSAASSISTSPARVAANAVTSPCALSCDIIHSFSRAVSFEHTSESGTAPPSEFIAASTCFEVMGVPPRPIILPVAAAAAGASSVIITTLTPARRQVATAAAALSRSGAANAANPAKV